MKKCFSCRETKPVSEYWPFPRSADGLRYSCKTCENAYQREYRRKNSDKVREWSRKSYLKIRVDPDKWRRLLDKARNAVGKDIPKYLWGKAKSRSVSEGLMFNIEIADVVIPDICPVLGIQIRRGAGGMSPNSPTIDRIVPDLGYVKGNIAVISWRANAIKGDASAEELEKVLSYVKAMGTELYADKSSENTA